MVLGQLGTKLGEGNEADFWDGLRSGERSIKAMFPRLFQLSSKKEGRVGGRPMAVGEGVET